MAWAPRRERVLHHRDWTPVPKFDPATPPALHPTPNACRTTIRSASAALRANAVPQQSARLKSIHSMRPLIKMCAENASEPSDAVELMLCCLTGRAPMDSKESTQNEQSPVIEIDFDAWVQALRAMSEGDPRWGLYERFVKDSERIYSEKRLLLEVAPAFKDLSASSATLH